MLVVSLCYLMPTKSQAALLQLKPLKPIHISCDDEEEAADVVAVCNDGKEVKPLKPITVGCDDGEEAADVTSVCNGCKEVKPIKPS